ncbi:hypothetical protein ABZP36_007068 [Zizania latifolia]
MRAARQPAAAAAAKPSAASAVGHRQQARRLSGGLAEPAGEKAAVAERVERRRREKSENVMHLVCWGDDSDFNYIFIHISLDNFHSTSSDLRTSDANTFTPYGMLDYTSTSTNHQVLGPQTERNMTVRSDCSSLFRFSSAALLAAATALTLPESTDPAAAGALLLATADEDEDVVVAAADCALSFTDLPALSRTACAARAPTRLMYLKLIDR